jgi:hypothetical protein
VGKTVGTIASRAKATELIHVSVEKVGGERTFFGLKFRERLIKCYP